MVVKGDLYGVTSRFARVFFFCSNFFSLHHSQTSVFNMKNYGLMGNHRGGEFAIIYIYISIYLYIFTEDFALK